MVFTEPPEKCPGDGLKTFRCYHLIADNIYKLLSSGHYQNSCNNSTNNNNSLVIPGMTESINKGKFEFHHGFMQKKSRFCICQGR